MRRIGELLAKWREQDREVAKRRDALVRHPDVAAFLAEHPNVPAAAIDRSLPTLAQFVREQENCRRCPGLESCPNMMKGHVTQLVLHGERIVPALKPCSLYAAEARRRQQQARFRSHHIPADVRAARFTENTIFDQYNREAIAAAIRFCQRFQPGKSPMGLYFYGPFGVGKSHLMAALANELAAMGYDSLMVYVPLFLQEMRDAVKDGTFSAKLEEVCAVPVLILDDIGAETPSPWARDEVLGAVLHHRVAHNRPTLYTSNLSYDELEEALAAVGGSAADRTKAKRIMERIRHYTEAYFLDGPNRRKRNKEAGRPS